MDTALRPRQLPESLTRKIATTCLLVLSAGMNVFLFIFAWMNIKPKNEMLNMLLMLVFVKLLINCVGLGCVLAFLTGIFSKGWVRKALGYTLASIDILIIGGLLCVLVR